MNAGEIEAIPRYPVILRLIGRPESRNVKVAHGHALREILARQIGLFCTPQLKDAEHPVIVPNGGSVRSGYVDAGSLNVTDSEGGIAPAQRRSSLDTELADWHPDPPDLCALWAGTWC